jgi:meiotically up-regulated gene 157 (Mug157) protein
MRNAVCLLLRRDAQIVEGAIRSQAYWILFDPYANAFNREWRKPDTFSQPDRHVGE